MIFPADRNHHHAGKRGASANSAAVAIKPASIVASPLVISVYLIEASVNQTAAVISQSTIAANQIAAAVNLVTLIFNQLIAIVVIRWTPIALSQSTTLVNSLEEAIAANQL